MAYYVMYKNFPDIQSQTGNCLKMFVCPFKGQKVHYFNWDTLYNFTLYDSACRVYYLLYQFYFPIFMIK